MYDVARQERFLEVAGSEQRVVGLSERWPVAELARAVGFRRDGSSPSGVRLQLVAPPAGLLSPVRLGNFFVHVEGFYQERDILRGSLGGPASPSQVCCIAAQSGSHH